MALDDSVLCESNGITSKDSYVLGREAAIKAIAKLKLKGPGAASCGAAEYRRGYNDIIKEFLQYEQDGQSI